jgi:hypothetical protein
MKVTVTLDVEPLPEDRLLAFFTKIGTATLDDRTFEITRSMTGLQFGLYEHTGEGLVIHTVSVEPAITAALALITGDDLDTES